jgi:outer membrane receptor protein involved in Fe transport
MKIHWSDCSSTLCCILAAAACSVPEAAEAKEATAAQSGGAEAQQPAEPQAPASQPDIIVTATKRSALLRDVPLPIQAITAETLQKEGARSFSDYSRTVAGLQAVDTGAGRDQIFMRGIAAPQGYIGMQSAIGVYLDEVPISEGSSQPDLNLYDIARVEVLRGPQGTLYGSASMGGTIRLVTNKPDPSRLSGFAEGDLSDTMHGGINAAYTGTLNVPITPDAAVRAVVYGRNMSGFIDDPLLGKSNANYENTYGGRLALRVNPIQNFTIDLMATHQDTKQGAYNEVDSRDGEVHGLDQYRHIPEPFLDRSTIANATIHYKTANFDIVSATSFDWRRRVVNDDFTGLDALGNLAVTPSIQKYRTRSFAQELRASSVGDSTVTWLAGGYYSHDRSFFWQRLDVEGAGALLGLPDDTLGILDQSTTTNELAAFGEIGIHPAAGLTLTGGLRYDNIKLDASSVRSGVIFGGVLEDEAHQSQDVLIPKINLSYKPTPLLLVYAQATKGYRIGGLNVSFASTGDGFVFPRSYKPDSLWNYEIGLKGTAWSGALDFDVDAFLIDWKNIQLDLQHEGYDYFANAGNARSKGVEAQMTLRPGPHWSLGGQLTYTDSRLTTSTPGIGEKGDRVPFVPRLSASGYVEYHTNVRGLGQSYARFDLQRVGRAYTGFGASDDFAYGNYAIANARIGTSIGGFDAAIYAKNLFDKRATLFAGAYLAGYPGLAESLTVARPRTIGFDVSRKF